jgi:hypothetical protein
MRHWIGSLLLFFVSCTSGFEIREFEKSVNRVSKRAGKSIEKKYTYLEFAGGGGGFTVDNSAIDHEALVFTTKKKLTENEGVILFSRMIDLYFKSLQKEEILFSYLKEHPFTYKNLCLDIMILNNSYKAVLHPHIHVMHLRDGRLWFYTVVPHEQYYYENKWEKKEPFKQAAQRLGVWKDEFETGPTIPG